MDKRRFCSLPLIVPERTYSAASASDFAATGNSSRDGCIELSSSITRSSGRVANNIRKRLVRWSARSVVSMRVSVASIGSTAIVGRVNDTNHCCHAKSAAARPTATITSTSPATAVQRRSRQGLSRNQLASNTSGKPATPPTISQRTADSSTMSAPANRSAACNAAHSNAR